MKGLLGFLLSLAIHYFLFECAQSSFQGSKLVSGFNQSEESLNTNDFVGLKEVSLQLARLHMDSMGDEESEQTQEEPQSEFISEQVENPDLIEKYKTEIEEKFGQVLKRVEVPLQEEEQEQEQEHEKNRNRSDEPQFDAKDLDKGKTKPELTELKDRKRVPKPEKSHQRIKEVNHLPEGNPEITKPRDSGSESVSKRTREKLDEIRIKDKPEEHVDARIEPKPEKRAEVRIKPKLKDTEETVPSPPQSSKSMISSKGSSSTKRSESKGTLEAPEILVRGKLIYPRVARRRGWQGKVVIEFSIDSEGTASDFRFVKKAPYDLLNREAVRSLKSYRFAKSAGSSGASSLRYPLSFEFRLD